MRATDFIVEYDQEKTLENYRKKLLDALMADERSPFGQELRKIYNANILNLSSPRVQEGFDRRIRQVLQQLEGADPTPNKRYVQWLVRGYINGFFRYFEDAVTKGSQFLQYYQYLADLRRVPEEIRDINQVKTRRDFLTAYDMIERLYRDIYWERVNRGKEEKAKAITDKGNSEEVLNNSEVRVLKILDKAASCYYGQSTRWCTAWTTASNYFNSYNAEYDLYIFIPKKAEYIGEKYQIALPMKGVNKKYILMDERDQPVSMKNFKNRWESFDVIEFIGSLSSHVKRQLLKDQ